MDDIDSFCNICEQQYSLDQMFELPKGKDNEGRETAPNICFMCKISQLEGRIMAINNALALKGIVI